jgi:hypothetical protein
VILQVETSGRERDGTIEHAIRQRHGVCARVQRIHAGQQDAMSIARRMNRACHADAWRHCTAQYTSAMCIE